MLCLKEIYITSVSVTVSSHCPSITNHLSHGLLFDSRKSAVRGNSREQIRETDSNLSHHEIQRKYWFSQWGNEIIHFRTYRKSCCLEVHSRLLPSTASRCVLYLITVVDYSRTIVTNSMQARATRGPKGITVYPNYLLEWPHSQHRLRLLWEWGDIQRSLCPWVYITWLYYILTVCQKHYSW